MKLLAGRNRVDCNFAFDLVEHLEQEAAPLLKSLAAGATGHSARQWKAALKLLG